ncbi:S-phase kinase-associated protein 1 [Drosophila ficusphila]|uniref:S-phase kinase-associated protein 1 n=1 Tax=Drosophila ficusphila TaxID=30025 RepID=UPI0007E68D27|nr:S-phase kinase-associated protein 1 [Drosophila ficusphila]
MPVIKLQSSDGEIFDVDSETAKCSSTIKTLLEDCGLESENDPVIPLPNVNSNILKKVLVWAKHHQADNEEEENAEEAAQPIVEISEWDASFLTMDQGTLFELILAANYLDIRNLMNAGCLTVANMIKGHTAEEIRQTFHIVNDFSPSEEDLLPAEVEEQVEEESTIYGDI